jgi:processive 1,2-diacylglycerol beta-glucosyltransferase
MPPERTTVRGYLMQPRQHIGLMDEPACAAYLEEELELRPDLFTVFLATGGNGANNHIDFLNELLPFADKVQAIVICGKNREVYNQVLHWRTEHPQLNCFLDGFSETVHLLMQVSDVIVTRGGTTSCAKALHFRCPILFNAIGGVMPQESLTVKFFSRGAGVEMIRNAADLGRIIGGWMADRSSYEHFRQDFLKLRYEENPTRLITELVDLAQEVSHTRYEPGPFPPKPRKG